MRQLRGDDPVELGFGQRQQFVEGPADLRLQKVVLVVLQVEHQPRGGVQGVQRGPKLADRLTRSPAVHDIRTAAVTETTAVRECGGKQHAAKLRLAEVDDRLGVRRHGDGAIAAQRDQLIGQVGDVHRTVRGEVAVESEEDVHGEASFPLATTCQRSSRSARSKAAGAT